MARGLKKKCTSCDGLDMTTLFEDKGNGRCRYCHGTGRRTLSEAIASFLTLDTIDNTIQCDTCTGTGQCQACGGCGYEYFEEPIDSAGGFEEDITQNYNDYDPMNEEGSSPATQDHSTGSRSNTVFSFKEKSIDTILVVVGIIVFFAYISSITKEVLRQFSMWLAILTGIGLLIYILYDFD